MVPGRPEHDEARPALAPSRIRRPGRDREADVRPPAAADARRSRWRRSPSSSLRAVADPGRRRGRALAEGRLAAARRDDAARPARRDPERRRPDARPGAAVEDDRRRPEGQLTNAAPRAVVIARALGFHQLKQAPPRPEHQKKQKLRAPTPRSRPDHGQAVEGSAAADGAAAATSPPAPARGGRPHHGPPPARHLDRHRADQRWYPPRAGRVAGARVHRHRRQRRPRARVAGLEHQYNQVLEGRPGKQVIVHDPSGQVLDTVQTSSARHRSQRHPHARRHRPDARCRTCSPRPCEHVGRKLGDRDRARPAHRRDPRHGHGARLRQQPGAH